MSDNRAERRRQLWITLIVVGVALIVAIGVWAFWVATEPPEDVAGPSAPRPSATASVPDPAESSAEVTTLAINTFVAHSAVAVCPDETATVPLIFSWRTQGAVTAWVGVGSSDAKAQPTAEVETTVNGYVDLSYPCALGTQVFTLTIEGEDGETVSSTVLVTRELPVVSFG